jgi:hypothetical protein
MKNFRIDYSGLDNVLNKKAYRLEDVKDRLEVVAFDVVRFKDADKGADLWQVQSADDGDYIVALYEPEEEKVANWEVVVTKTAADLQIFYKGDPIVRVASSSLGIPRNELYRAERYLPSKLADNKKLVDALLKEIPEKARKEVLKKYPELV